MRKSVAVVLSIVVLSILGTGCTKKDKIDISDKPYAKWTSTDVLAGSRTYADAIAIPGANRWYRAEMTNAFQWFVLQTEPGKTYNLYWDDTSEGSGAYSGDVVMWVFKNDGTTKFDSKDNGYREPIVIKAEDSEYFIAATALTRGTFAFGIVD